MGQQISDCKTASDTSIGSFDLHISDYRKRRLLGTVSKSFLLRSKTKINNNTNDESTASTGLSSSKTSVSPPYPLYSSICATEKDNGPATSSNISPNTTKNHVHNPLALRYTTSTRYLRNPNKEAATTTTTTSIPSVQPYVSRVDSYPQQKQKRGEDRFRSNPGTVKPFLLRTTTAPTDKRSNPVKFPGKRQSYGYPNTQEKRNDTSTNPDASSNSCTNLQDTSYLERMYDSRTWEMYQRITNHREKVVASNAANASAKQQEESNDDDRNHSTNQSYMSDPVQRVTNSSTMEGGVDYDNFYDPAMDDDNDSRGAGAEFHLEDHSAPPYHHHRQCDNGQHHYHHGGACYHQYGGQFHKNCDNNTEIYSEWEHMYGDEVEIDGNCSNDASNTRGGHHETIFLFDF